MICSSAHSLAAERTHEEFRIPFGQVKPPDGGAGARPCRRAAVRVADSSGAPGSRAMGWRYVEAGVYHRGQGLKMLFWALGGNDLVCRPADVEMCCVVERRGAVVGPHGLAALLLGEGELTESCRWRSDR